MDSYDTIPEAEHTNRLARVLSVACPACGRGAWRRCVRPSGNPSLGQHGTRWDAWYAAHPDTNGSITGK